MDFRDDLVKFQKAIEALENADLELDLNGAKRVSIENLIQHSLAEQHNVLIEKD